MLRYWKMSFELGGLYHAVNGTPVRISKIRDDGTIMGVIMDGRYAGMSCSWFTNGQVVGGISDDWNLKSSIQSEIIKITFGPAEPKCVCNQVQYGGEHESECEWMEWKRNGLQKRVTE